MPKIFMGTTNVPVHRTIAEVQAVLVRAGAKQISQDYTSDGAVTGMCFSLEIGKSLLRFDLPVRTEQVYKAIHSERKRRPEKYVSEDQADAMRIAWRQLLRWVEAQIAMIDIGMVQPHEVFMPYAVDKAGRTMFQIWSTQLALPAPKS